MALENLSTKVESASFANIVRALMPEMPDPVLSALERIGQLRFYEAGCVVAQERTESQGVVVLCSGLVTVSLQSAAGMTVKLREIAAPATLGLSETMLGQTFKASIRCAKPVEAAFLPAPQFLAVMRQFPAASLQFSGLVTQELHAMYARLLELRKRIPPAAP